MDLGLSNKRALILASSSGLGRAVALELAREGAAVVVCSRDQESVNATVRVIHEETGADVHGIQVDVSVPGSLERLFEEASEVLGGVDILVTNAGGPPPGGFEKLEEDQWAAAFELTLMSVIRSIKLALPHFRSAGGGSVLALGSSSVKRPIPNLLLSNVFRPAVQALCKHLAEELAGDKVRVNCLSPGRILTERTAELDRARAEREGKSLEEVRTASILSIPMGRLGEPEEFGRVAAFLCSDAASYMTGSSILVDGGMVRCL